MASAARGATVPRLKQVNLPERALRLLRVDIARINVGKPRILTISDPLLSAVAVPALDLAKHLGVEVVAAVRVSRAPCAMVIIVGSKSPSPNTFCLRSSACELAARRSLFCDCA